MCQQLLVCAVCASVATDGAVMVCAVCSVCQCVPQCVPQCVRLEVGGMVGPWSCGDGAVQLGSRACGARRARACPGPCRPLASWGPCICFLRISLFIFDSIRSGLFLYVNRLDDQFAASRIAVVWSGVRVRVGRRARAGGRPRPATRGPGSAAGAAAGTGTVVRAARGRLCLRPRQKMAEEVGVCGVQGCMSPRVWRPSKLEPEP